MSEKPKHSEGHFVSRVSWLRAAVLGANDGIVSTASLILGVAAANGGRSELIVAGVAGLVAGAMSMAAGEYVSVSSQADTEAAELDRERAELLADPQGELQELTDIYIARGVSPETAREVARQLTAKDALQAHARDELAITEQTEARPIQAAYTSAATFSLGAAMPLLLVAIAPSHWRVVAVALASLLSLALLGWAAAKAGGASVTRAIVRVTFWGALAMLITAGIGKLVGTAL